MYLWPNLSDFIVVFCNWFTKLNFPFYGSWTVDVQKRCLFFITMIDEILNILNIELIEYRISIQSRKLSSNLQIVKLVLFASIVWKGNNLAMINGRILVRSMFHTLSWNYFNKFTRKVFHFISDLKVQVSGCLSGNRCKCSNSLI